MDLNNIDLKVDDVEFWGEHEINKGGMRIFWGSTIGFGTLDIVKRSGSEDELILTADTEGMDSQDDKNFTRKLLDLLAEHLQILD